MNIIDAYQEMRTKWGWSDGDREPAGSYDVRDEIVKIINSNLPDDCPIEAYGYDRPGLHNGALILYREKGSENEQEAKEPDEVWKILEAACEDWDVYTTIEIDGPDEYNLNKLGGEA